MLLSRSFTNTLVLRALPEQRETMLASTEGASGENLERLTRVLRKSTFCTTVLEKAPKKTESFQSAPKSLIYEYVGFARASGPKRKRCRGRRRERRKFGAFYARFMQKCFLYHCFWQNVLHKRSVLIECSKVTHLRIRWFRARLRNKEKAMSRAPKARAEKIWSIIRKLYAKVSFVPLCSARSAQKTECLQNAPKSFIYEYVGFARP